MQSTAAASDHAILPNGGDSVKPEEEISLSKGDLQGLVGKHIKYTYSNGWQYEMYYKNADTIDYKVLSGKVGGRWVKDQNVHMRQIGEQRYMVNWTEPTGTCVSKVVDMEKHELNTVIFFPRWIKNDPSKTVLFQNDHLDLMLSCRDAGPTYPIDAVNESGRIDFVEDSGPNNDKVIS